MSLNRTRDLAERAVRDPGVRESAAELASRLRDLAVEDRARSAGRTFAFSALTLIALIGLAGVILKRPDRGGYR
jgi:hypothetical protein